MAIKKGFCVSDVDGLVYRREDTYWLIEPDHEEHDPGVLDCKSGAEPVSPDEYEE